MTTTEAAASLDSIRTAVRDVCANFPDAYWRDLDKRSEYPEEFIAELTRLGWLGAMIPEEYGGGGLGVTEGSVILEEINRSGGNAAPGHAQMYTMGVLLRHGSEEQKQRYLPGIASGELRLQAFGVTEPNAGSETTRLETTAVRDGDRYVVNGQKIFISRARHSDLMLLLARTTPYDELDNKTQGLSTFLVDLREAGKSIDIRPIDVMLNHHTTQIFFDNVEVPAENLIGEEGRGFRYIIDSWNAERILIAAECVGDGYWFIDRAVEYANKREVFGRPIGANQGVQFPIAQAYANIEAADMVRYAAAGKVRPRRVVRQGSQHGQVAHLPGFVGGGQRLHDHLRRLRLRRRVRCRAQVPRDPPVHDRSGQQQPSPRLPRPEHPRSAPLVLALRGGQRASIAR